MSGDQNPRRLLPQSSQMQSFSFAPNNFASRENQKNYVFVDEHNRHKRLKVMRACEGCRRRKIKCDAATTNTWPCSACIRLKLHCIPPTVNYEREFPGTGQGFEGERVAFDSNASEDEYSNQLPLQQQQQLAGSQKSGQQQLYSQQVPYNEGVGVFNQASYGQPSQGQQSLQFGQMPGPNNVLDGQYTTQNVFPATPIHQQQQPSLHQSSESPDSTAQYQEQYHMQDLADLLGDLKMDARGSAPYLSSKGNKMKSSSSEDPAFEELDEYKHTLPLVTSGPDMKIRIPPELMPDEETSLHYFDLYFTNVHPYVPVLNKAQFYQQWHNNRDAISPLILEAIFAIAGRLVDEPSQGQQWLALAACSVAWGCCSRSAGPGIWPC